MTSIRRIQANQQNSQLSTGPRTPAGKAIVSQNALKTGFDARALSILGEDPFDFESLRAEYYDRWNPTAPEQRALVDTLIANEWLLRRYDRLETQLWQNSMPPDDRFNSETYLAHAFGAATPLFDRVARYRNTAQPAYQSALRELKLLKKEELAAPEPLNPSPIGIPSRQLLDPPPVSAPIGFVPQVPAAPDSVAWARNDTASRMRLPEAPGSRFPEGA